MNNSICDRNIKLLTLYTVFANMSFILPVILPFYREELGLSFHDFLMGEVVFSLALIFFDVPAGYLADRWGRKKTMALGAFIFAAGYFLLSMATGFWSAIAIQGILGIGLSTISGSNSAFLYDNLLSAGREHEYRQREGFRFAIQLYSITLACVIGGYLYDINHDFPLILATITYSFAGVIALFMIEPERHKIIIKKHPLRDIRDTMIFVLHGHREIAAIALLMIIVFSTTKICMWSIQAYAGELKIPEIYNGWIMAAVMLLGALAGHFGHHVFKELRGEKVLYCMIFFLAFIMLVSGILGNYLGLAILGLEAFVFGFAMPRAQQAINDLVDSSRRATVLSTANLAMSLGFIPLSQMLGYLSEEVSLFTGLIVYSFVLVILAGIAKLITNKRRPL
jgi:MFS family permease